LPDIEFSLGEHNLSPIALDSFSDRHAAHLPQTMTDTDSLSLFSTSLENPNSESRASVQQRILNDSFASKFTPSIPGSSTLDENDLLFGAEIDLAPHTTTDDKFDKENDLVDKENIDQSVVEDSIDDVSQIDTRWRICAELRCGSLEGGLLLRFALCACTPSVRLTRLNKPSSPPCGLRCALNDGNDKA